VCIKPPRKQGGARAEAVVEWLQTEIVSRQSSIVITNEACPTNSFEYASVLGIWKKALVGPK
jgi:hypothetical protein